MTAAILEAHGLRTGTYLSPHLSSFAERVRVGDRDAEPERFAAAVQRSCISATTRPALRISAIWSAFLRVINLAQTSAVTGSNRSSGEKWVRT